MTYLELLTGKTAFLNGDGGFDEMVVDLRDLLKESGREIILIDRLYYDAKKIANIVGCDNVVIYTQSVYWDKIEYLISVFERLKYVPKNVLFVYRVNHSLWMKPAVKLSKKGTKFWLAESGIFEDDFPPVEINWANIMLSE